LDACTHDGSPHSRNERAAGRVKKPLNRKALMTHMVSGGEGDFVFCGHRGQLVHLRVCKMKKHRACNRCRYSVGQMSLFDLTREKGK
jgi:hypothetical protein